MEGSGVVAMSTHPDRDAVATPERPISPDSDAGRPRGIMRVGSRRRFSTHAVSSDHASAPTHVGFAKDDPCDNGPHARTKVGFTSQPPSIPLPTSGSPTPDTPPPHKERRPSVQGRRSSLTHSAATTATATVIMTPRSGAFTPRSTDALEALPAKGFVSGLETADDQAKDKANFEGVRADPGAYQDQRGFMPIVAHTVETHKGVVSRAKWGSRLLLVAVFLGVLAMIIVFTVARKKREGELETYYGDSNSTVMLLVVRGRYEDWSVAHFTAAVSAETVVAQDLIEVWLVVPQYRELDEDAPPPVGNDGEPLPNVLLVYFQFVGLGGVVTVQRAVDLLMGSVSRDVRGVGGRSSFLTRGYVLVDDLEVDKDLNAVDRPGPPPATNSPPTAAPTDAPATATVSLTYDTHGVLCGDRPAPHEKCDDSLHLDAATGRCVCKWAAGNRLVCMDHACVSPRWTCDTGSSVDGSGRVQHACGMPFTECRDQCERSPFCIGFIHDPRKPGGYACFLRWQKMLGLPSSVGQLKGFATECKLAGQRLVPKLITVDPLPRLVLNRTRAIVYIAIDTHPTKGKVYITPTAPGVAFTPYQLFFDTRGAQSIAVVVEAKETVTSPTTGLPVFAAAIGSARPGGGYAVSASFLTSGPAAAEFAEVEDRPVYLSDEGRGWMLTDLAHVTVLAEGVRRQVKVSLSSPLSFNISVSVVTHSGNPAGLAFYPAEVVFPAFSVEETFSVFGVLAGRYVVRFNVPDLVSVPVAGSGAPFSVETRTDSPGDATFDVQPAYEPGKAHTLAVGNVARIGTATQSSVPPGCAGCGAGAAIDGVVTAAGNVSITSYRPVDQRPSWRLVLPRPFAVTRIVVHNRKDCCLGRFWNIRCDVFLNGVLQDSETLGSRGAAHFEMRRVPMVVFDTLVISKSIAPGTEAPNAPPQLFTPRTAAPLYNSIDATLNLLEVEVFTPDFKGIGLEGPPTPPPVTLQPVPTQFAPVVYNTDEDLYEVAWVGTTNQSSVMPSCPTCAGGTTPTNHRICTSAAGGSEYTMTNGGTVNPDLTPWLSISFPLAVAIHTIIVWNRADCCQHRLHDVVVVISHESTLVWTSTVKNPGNALGSPQFLAFSVVPPIYGTKINITKQNPAATASIDMVLSVAELEVYSSTKIDPIHFPQNVTGL